MNRYQGRSAIASPTPFRISPPASARMVPALQAAAGNFAPEALPELRWRAQQKSNRRPTEAADHSPARGVQSTSPSRGRAWVLAFDAVGMLILVGALCVWVAKLMQPSPAAGEAGADMSTNPPAASAVAGEMAPASTTPPAPKPLAFKTGGE